MPTDRPGLIDTAIYKQVFERPKRWNIMAGCSSTDGVCSTEPTCWAKALYGGRLRHHPDAEGLVEQVCSRCDGLEPVEGCTPVLRWTGRINLFPERLSAPADRKKPSVILVAFGGDLALADEEFVRRVFEAMCFPEAARKHSYLVLTKRWPMLAEKLGLDHWRSGTQYIQSSDAHYREHGHTVHELSDFGHVWVGFSASTQAELDDRAGAICDEGSEAYWPGPKWLNYEPAMGPLDLSRWLPGHNDDGFCSRCGCEWEQQVAHECPPGFGGTLDWIIAGSSDTLAHGAAAFTPDIARGITRQCAAAGVPCYVKQGLVNRDCSNVLEWHSEGTRQRVVAAPVIFDPQCDVACCQWLQLPRALAAHAGEKAEVI